MLVCSRALTSLLLFGALLVGVPSSATAAPAAPSCVKAVSGSTSTVALDWNDVQGATSYEVWEDLYRSARKLATVSASAYTTGKLAKGKYRFYVKARDASGASGISPKVTIPVPNGGTVTSPSGCDPNAAPPTVTVTGPAAGSTVSGTAVTLDASSSNATKVEYLVDGAKVAEDASCCTWEEPWDSTTVADGTHTLVARATNSVGVTDSAPVSFTVDNVVESGEPVAPVQDPRSPLIPAAATEVFTGDYDTGDLSQWETCQTVLHNGRCRDNPVGYPLRVMPSGQREGSHMARFEVRDGDIPSFGGGERAEVSEVTHSRVANGQEMWYQFSVFFDPTFNCADVSSYFIVMQWHSGSGSPPAALTVDSSCRLRLSNLTTQQHSVIGDIDKGQWVDYVLHGNFTDSSLSGWAEVWRNGVRTVPLHQRAMVADESSYLKQGIYRDNDAVSTAIVHHDGIRAFRVADTQAPSVPSGVTATADSATSVTVKWSPSTDDVGVASYQVKRGGTVVADAVSSGTSFTDTTVAASTTYSYTVNAVDAAGNRSADSTAASVTTPAASGGTATTVTRGAAADTRVEEATPTANYGSAATLGTDASSAVQSYLRFDTGSLAGSVTKAVLRLYVTNASADAPAVYPTSNEWSETSMTWNTKPAATGGAIADKGGVSAGTWVEYDVTSYVKAAGTYSLHLASTSSDGTDFSSKEAATSSQRPQLVITTTG